MSSADPRPLIVHIVHRFSVGGLENGLVNLLNRLPASLARHCVLALTTTDPAFAARVRTADVEFVDLDKPPGQTAWILPAVYRELRRRRPSIVHTRNITALECQVAAWAARVPIRIHGEHGWDVNDLHGSNLKYARLRRLLKPLVHHHVALSRRTREYLTDVVRVPRGRISELCNGVDVSRFTPSALPVELAGGSSTRGRSQAEDLLRSSDRMEWSEDSLSSTDSGRLPSWIGGAREGHHSAGGHFIVGTVGRLAGVKNQRLLCEAFLLLRDRNPAFRERGRLLIVGEGPDRAMLERLIDDGGAGRSGWFAGERDDIPHWLSLMDVFCLPSLAEGISNSILESMACGRAVIATRVGGNAELVVDGVSGTLLVEISPAAMADAIETYFLDPSRCLRHGLEARARAVEQFSLEAMVGAYESLYNRLLSDRTSRAAGPNQEKHSCAG